MLVALLVVGGAVAANEAQAGAQSSRAGTQFDCFASLPSLSLELRRACSSGSNLPAPKSARAKEGRQIFIANLAGRENRKKAHSEAGRANSGPRPPCAPARPQCITWQATASRANQGCARFRRT